MKKAGRRILAMFMMLLLVLGDWAGCGLTLRVQASEPDLHDISIEVVHCQSEARRQLDMVNAFRTGSEAWYYDQNGNVVSDLGLSELQYDYGLERAAVKRAVETALYFAHTRPDGSDCFSAYEITNGYRGENLAAGHSSSEVVISAWKETNSGYSGQGHRRNMLNAGFKYMATACVSYKGCLYWVQEFCSKPTDLNYTDANDSTTVETVKVDVNEGAYIAGGAESPLRLTKGEAYTLPVYTGYFEIGHSDWEDGTQSASMTLPVSWTLADPSFGTISNGKLTALVNGTSTIHGVYSFLDSEYDVSFELDSQLYATSVEMQEKKLNLGGGESYGLTARALPEGAVDGALSFVSADPDLVTVNEEGVITAATDKSGTTTVTASTRSGLSASCQVTVNACSSITMDVKYRQSEARELLDLVNALRAEAGAEALQWDYGMEAGTMVRTPELYFNWGILRPCGSYSDLMYGRDMGLMELFKKDREGDLDAQGVLGRMENDEMSCLLRSDLCYMAASCIEAGEWLIWDVQVAPEPVNGVDGGSETTAADAERNVTVKVVHSDISGAEIKADPENGSEYKLTEGEEAALPVLQGCIGYQGGSLSIGTLQADWSVSDPEVAEVTEGKLRALKAGSATVSANISWQGRDFELSYPLTVAAKKEEEEPVITPTQEETTAPVYTVEVTYGQTEARKLEDMVNDFRTGSEAWYYDASGGKVTLSGLNELEYDYELEAAAMQRAAEVALMFSHTRPNGESCFTVYDFYGGGENIAAGYGSAEAVMEGWKETNESYSGQGHRRNMLGNHKYIGIGHAVLNGVHYWTMELAGNSGDLNKRPANDAATDVDVEILDSNITSSSLSASLKNGSVIKAELMETTKLPVFKGLIRVKGHWPSGSDIAVKLKNLQWKLEDPEFARIEDGMITPLKTGDCGLSAGISFGGSTKTCQYTLHVPLHPSSVEISPSSLNLNLDDNASVTALVLPEDADDTSVSFSSSDSSVATVDAQGRLQAVGVGTAVITVTTNDGGLTDSCEVKVSSTMSVKAPLASLAEGEVKKGSMLSLRSLTPDAEIYYTLDGSEPTAAEGTLYSEAFAINSSLTLRAVAIKKGVCSPELVCSYTVLAADWGQVAEEDRTQWTSAEELPEGIWIAEASVPETVYNAKAQKPTAFRIYAHDTLLGSKDYSVKYSNNTAAGEAKAVFSFKGSYSGSLTQAFTIMPADLSEAVADPVSRIYNGAEQIPAFVVRWQGKKLKEGTDYVLQEGSAATEPGSYSLNLQGVGNYSGELQAVFTILPEGTPDLAKAKVSKIPAQSWYEGMELSGTKDLKTAKGAALDLSVKLNGAVLTEGVDYSAHIINGDAPGKATLVLEAMGDKLCGTKYVHFTIKAQSLKKAVSVAAVPAQEYTGEAITPAVELRNSAGDLLQEGVHYSCTYRSNVKPGTAKIVLNGIAENGYSGSLTIKFKITKVSLADAEISYDSEVRYTKGSTLPQVEVRISRGGESILLTEGKDYTIKGSNNKKVTGENAAKKPSFVIVGKGGYSGKSSAQIFTITPADLSAVEVYAADVVYKDKAGVYKSKPILRDSNGKKLKAGTDYDSKNLLYRYDEDCVVYTTEGAQEQRYAGQVVQAQDIVQAGTALQIRIAGKGNYTSRVLARYRVVQASLSKAKGSIAAQAYTGEAICLSKSDIKLSVGGTELSGSDYEILSYSSNTKVGTATVLIAGRGNYGGQKKLSFKIVKRTVQ